MNIPPLSSSAGVDTSNIPVEDLAGNKHLTKQQKIHEASRQFEAIMLQQIMSEMQKPVINSEFTDDSTAAGIYQDYMTNALSQSMSKNDSLGFAKIFEEQLSPHPSKPNPQVSAMPTENSAVKKTGSAFLPHT
ncbi:MAG TPA: rod-binding protein [Verrucomicrobiae bacterium]|jgi:Rod binding domain-containing protein